MKEPWMGRIGGDLTLNIRSGVKPRPSNLRWKWRVSSQSRAMLICRPENDKIRENLAIADAECKSLTETITGLNSEITKNAMICTAKDETIARLERNIQKSIGYDQHGKAELAMQVAHAESTLGDLQAEITGYRAETQRLREQSSNTSQALEERSEELSGLRSMVQKLEQGSHVLTGKLRDKEALLDNAQRELLDKAARGNDREIVSTRERADVLHWEAQDRVEKIQELERQPASCVAGRESLEPSIRDLRTQLGGATGQMQSHFNITEDLRGRISIHEQEDRRPTEKYEEERGVSHSLRAKIVANTTNLSGTSALSEVGHPGPMKTGPRRKTRQVGKYDSLRGHISKVA